MKMETELQPELMEPEHGNIILSGFMGCGKTTIGRRLASVLQMKFVDMDLYIEKKTGLTVSEIFAQHGEAYFRALETETVRELSKEKHYVIATGGGTLMRRENMDEFHRGGGKIYYLSVPLAALKERLKNDKRRPLLQTPDRNAVIERLLEERTPQYLASADVVVDAGAPTIVVVRRICALRGAEPESTAARTPRDSDGAAKRKKRRRRGKRGSGAQATDKKA